MGGDKMIILITGDFGVGKDTFADFLLEEMNKNSLEVEKPDVYVWGAKKIKSFTTRKPRYEGEDTHTFISREKWLEMREKPGCIIAETEIDGEFYGTAKFQFQHNKYFSIYVVDDIGVRDMLAAKEILKEPIFVIEIFRPKSLRNVDESRLNRIRNLESYRVYPDAVVYNKHDLISLQRDAHEMYENIIDHIISTY